jgi:RNA polymerase sigma-70 factor (ECF subfamily)
MALLTDLGDRLRLKGHDDRPVSELCVPRRQGMTDEGHDLSARLSAARAGSSESLGQLLEAYRGYLLLIAQQELDPLLRAKGGASDLVQQTFLEAQRDFPQFHGQAEGELVGWLRRLLLNNLHNFARQYRDSGKRQISREQPLAGDGSSDGVREPRDPEPSPSGLAMARERTAALETALARLPEEYRRVLLLRYDEGRSFEEIGALMGRTANAARKLWLRAVEKLQQDLDAPP